MVELQRVRDRDVVARHDTGAVVFGHIIRLEYVLATITTKLLAAVVVLLRSHQQICDNDPR